jgi:hypothetical protein
MGLKNQTPHVEAAGLSGKPFDVGWGNLITEHPDYTTPLRAKLYAHSTIKIRFVRDKS